MVDIQSVTFIAVDIAGSVEWKNIVATQSEKHSYVHTSNYTYVASQKFLRILKWNSPIVRTRATVYM